MKNGTKDKIRMRRILTVAQEVGGNRGLTPGQAQMSEPTFKETFGTTKRQCKEKR